MKIKKEDLEYLVQQLNSNDLQSIKYQDGDFKIQIEKPEKNVILSDNDFLKSPKCFEDKSISEVTQPKQEEGLIEVKSPLIGNFYLTKNPEAKPFVAVGDKIKKGQTLAVIEAMKMINEVKSDYEGVITQICVEPGEFVDLDTVIMKLK